MGHLVRVQIRLSRFGLCSGWPTSVSVRVEFGSGPVLVECIRFGYGYGSSLVWIGSISKDPNSGRFGSGSVGVRIGLTLNEIRLGQFEYGSGKMCW